MTKLHNDVFDAALNEIATGTRLAACSAEPANYAGIAAVLLGSYTLTGGDYTNADGSPDGRQVTIGAQTGNNATASGDASHWSLDDGTTQLASGAFAATKTVTSSEPFDIGSFVITLRDPT